MADWQGSKTTLWHPFKNQDSTSVPFTQRAKISTASDFPIVDINTTNGDYTEVETEILTFCEQEAEKAKQALSQTYRDGKEISNIDNTRKILSKLTPAKLALN